MTVGVAAAPEARCAPCIHALFVVMLLFVSSAASAQTTLNAVKARALLNCGANGSLPGFGAVDAKGRWTGFDVDYCRAVGAAMFDDAILVAFFPLATKDRFTALQSGDVDVPIRNTTWTSSRDTALGLQFTGVNFYDYQAFLVPKSLQVKSAVGLSNVSVCVQRDTTTEENLADFFRAHELKLKTLVFRTAEAAIEAYDSGRCDAYADDASGIRSRMRSLTYPDQHEILGDVIA